MSDQNRKINMKDIIEHLIDMSGQSGKINMKDIIKGLIDKNVNMNL